MHSTAKLILGALLLLGIVDLGNGLKCYSCAYVEIGNLDLIDGFAGATQDASCEWGRQPDDKFLVDCTANNDTDPGFRYFHTCVFTKLNGKLQAQEAEFNGTLWSCATRRQAVNPPDSSNKVNLFKEFKQGRLADVTRDFQDLTGKEVLQNLSKIFDNEVTNTKFVSCDVDACVELDEPVTDTTTTSTVETSLTDLGSSESTQISTQTTQDPVPSESTQGSTQTTDDSVPTDTTVESTTPNSAAISLTVMHLPILLLSITVLFLMIRL